MYNVGRHQVQGRLGVVPIIYCVKEYPKRAPGLDSCEYFWYRSFRARSWLLLAARVSLDTTKVEVSQKTEVFWLVGRAPPEGAPRQKN